MWPFKKKKKYQIHFTCNEWAIRKYAPIQPAKNFPPLAFKEMDAILAKGQHPLYNRKTVKSCVGIIDYYSTGFVIPAWCDIEIMPSPDGRNVNVRYSHPKFKHEAHPPEVLQTLMSHKFGVRNAIKLDNPWSVWTEEGYGVMYLPMYYYDDSRNWEAIPGWVDFDLSNVSNPINIMLKEPKHTIIRQGEPLVQLVPIKREKIEAYTGDHEKTSASRYLGASYLKMMSFNGWIKHIRDKSKLYIVDAHDTELPTDIQK